MRTRNKGYSDYGFKPGEEKRLIQYCRSCEFDKSRQLLMAAIDSNSDLANDLYYSIVGNVSFDNLNMIKYIPASKGDFYGYRRKCLALVRDLLKNGIKDEN